jgi:single-strand DNA-binding protein
MINKVILVGHVGADPEIHTFESGKKTAKLRFATSERTYNKDTNETTEYTEWHTVVAWGNLADIIDRWVKKGVKLYIEGSLRTREYDKGGEKRHTIEIVAKELKMLGGRPTEGAGNSAGQTYTPQPQPAPAMPTAPTSDTLEDLPF